MQKITLLFLSTLLAIIPITSMEYKSDLATLPDEAAIIVVASCEKKNILRQTCKRFSDFASRRKNENILVQPQLYLTQEALDRYLLYYGALGNTAIVRNLLDRGANPNACEDNGLTLLHYAMQYGYDDIVNTLLKHPDLRATNAMDTKNYEFLSKMKRIRMNGSPVIDDDLDEAVCRGCTSAVQLLVDHGANVNIKDTCGETPLHCAVAREYTKLVLMLLENGANVNAERVYRCPALRTIVCKRPLDIGKNDAIKKLLRAHGGRGINEYTSFDYTWVFLMSSFCAFFGLYLVDSLKS